VEQLLSISIFLALAIGFVLVNLTVGKMVRPNVPNRDKLATYECGEPTIGSSWVQFDLRFYIVALFYLVFDVEVALIYPWAVMYRQLPDMLPALIVGAPFLMVIVIGYVYEWYSGSLDWVRSSINTSVKSSAKGVDLSALARRDPEALADETEAASERT
jgi:NADH-quinone oxidoreductase subunit A